MTIYCFGFAILLQACVILSLLWEVRSLDERVKVIERAPKLSFAEQHRVLSEFLDPTPTRKQRLLRAIAGALRRLAAWVEN